MNTAADTVFQPLLAADPGAPMITHYDLAAPSRIELSVTSTANWAAKIANMLEEELDLEEGSTIAIDLPVGWQAAVTVFGALAARVNVRMASEPIDEDAVFTTLERHEAWAGSGADVLLVSADPFGRGIEESGGEMPFGALDFGPTVRFYGDQYFGDAPALPELIDAPTTDRLLSTGWTDFDGFTDVVLRPLAGGGSAVVVAGVTDTDRLDEIAASEKATARA